MTKPKTTLANSPWPTLTPPSKGKKTRSGTVKPAEIESGDELVICNDPPPSSTLGPRVSKYYAKFEGLLVGQCLSCSKEKASPVANAMRAWIKKTGRKGVGVISISDYGDGKGRVWLVKAEKETSK